MNIDILSMTPTSRSGEELREEEIEIDFDVVTEALLYDEKAETESLYFQCLVTSPSMIGKRQPGGSILPTLLLEEFSEGEV